MPPLLIGKLTLPSRVFHTLNFASKEWRIPRCILHTGERWYNASWCSWDSFHHRGLRWSRRKKKSALLTTVMLFLIRQPSGSGSGCQLHLHLYIPCACSSKDLFEYLIYWREIFPRKFSSVMHGALDRPHQRLARSSIMWEICNECWGILFLKYKPI